MSHDLDDLYDVFCRVHTAIHHSGDERRAFPAGTAAAGAAALAGRGSLGQASGEEYEVGDGDYQTTVSSGSVPQTLYVSAVRTPWSNRGAIVDSFAEGYDRQLNDDRRSPGEALSDTRANARDPTHSADERLEVHMLDATGSDLGAAAVTLATDHAAADPHR